MKPRSAAHGTQVEPVASAQAVGLRYVTSTMSGIRRVKAGGGFRYVGEQGNTVRDESILRRIRSLAIPPAWTDVWICPLDHGHLQATGRDAKGRKQHRYHPLWRQARDTTKYDRMVEFAEALPRLRRRVTRDLSKPGLHREKVLATIIRLMDLTFIRIGNEEYAKNNRSYGLTTMKDQHAIVRGERVQFSFRGKSGKFHTIEVQDRRLAQIVKKCREIPGQDLFQYYDDEGAHHDVTSGDVNDYLREISGSDFTAKDFRTWAGTVLATNALKASVAFETQKQAKRNVTRAIEQVAQRLGNTPAVCRKCYVHPSILDGYMNKKLPCNGRADAGNGDAGISATARPNGSLGRDEKEVLEFLRCCRREEKLKARRMAPKLARIPRAWHPRELRPKTRR